MRFFLFFFFFYFIKSSTSLTNPVDSLWPRVRNNKQTHKLEFYLNIHETRYKKRPRGDLQKKFLSKSLFIRVKKKKMISSSPLNSQFTARALTKLFNGHRLRNRQQLNEIMNYDNVLRSISASLRSAKSRPAINFNVRRTRSNCKTNRTRFETPNVSLLHPVVFIDSFRGEWQTSVERVRIYPIHSSWSSWQKVRGIKYPSIMLFFNNLEH